MDEFIAIFGICALALVAHGSNHLKWLQWILRVTYSLFMLAEFINLASTDQELAANNPWTHFLLVTLLILSLILLFKPGRKVFSIVLTFINQVVSFRLVLALFGRLKIADETATESTAKDSLSSKAKTISPIKALFAESIFIPQSIPHLHGMWVYLNCLIFALSRTELSGFDMPSMGIPMPAAFDQLFSYNFLGLIFLSVCGVGIFITRKPLAVLSRLGFVRPTWVHVGIGLLGIVMTFAYDWLWSFYTHGLSGLEYGDKLSRYNEGTFKTDMPSGGSPSAALALATATGFCAGVGEETLIRGALQPVIGILPAAFLHGVLHAQFQHAPLLMLQVAGWSTIMGIIRRYTNTTTTLITHLGFNLLSTFLFAYNP